jgi:hypothetical protein
MIHWQSALCCCVASFFGVELHSYLLFSSAMVNLYSFCMYVATDVSSNNFLLFFQMKEIEISCSGSRILRSVFFFF